MKHEDNEKNTNQSKLPLDLEMEILTRLPAKSLMKFLCVSKTWSSIIRNQKFIVKREDPSLFIFSSSYEPEVSSSLVTNLDMTMPSLSMITLACKCASVHGFIGCTNDGGPFVVCNPSTKKVTTIPNFHGANTSLGYDPVTDQLKVLSVITNYHTMSLATSLDHEVLTLGSGREISWRRNRFTSPLYFPVTSGICINGFVYQSAWYPRRRVDPVIMCFDVRYEKQSFIKAPLDVVIWESEIILIEYKGKLASIVRHPSKSFCSFDLWILEDPEKHDWSKQTFELPFSLGFGTNMTSPGTNKAGEIIFAPEISATPR